MKIIFYLSLFINFLLTQNHVFAKQPILILGDSLTEGYGIEKKNSYPSILQKILITNGYTNYRVINGGISGSTTASGKSRLRWFFKASPEIMILALGGNDGLRGLKVEQSEENLSTIIKMAKDKKIKVILSGIQVPTNYGKDYRAKFSQMFINLKEKHHISFIPFLLEGVGGVKELNQEDGIHPNAKGHKIMANLVYQYLRPLLTKTNFKTTIQKKKKL